MSTQTENAVINLVINGKQAMATYTELSKARKEQLALVKKLGETDPMYQKQLQRLREISAVERARKDQINGTTKELQKQNGFFKDFFNSFSLTNQVTGGVAMGTLVAGAVTAAAGAFVSLGRSVVNTYVTFEKFGTILTNALGDQSSSRRALNMLQDFAAKTPFALEELTGSYVKLVNRGIIPTQEELLKMGDLAASQGKSFDQLTEAILDATTGEFERLKEFGIRASKDGDVVRLSFKGITQEVKNTEDAIQSAILKFGEMEGVAGGMQKLSETVGGQISNMGDNWDRLLAALGSKTAGWLYSVTSAINEHLDMLVEAVKTTEQRIQEVADASAGDALKRFKKMGADQQKALYEGSKLEIKYYEEQLIALKKKKDDIYFKRGNGKKVAEVQRSIDDITLNLAKEKAFVETVDAYRQQSADAESKKKEQKRQEDEKKADEDAKKQKKLSEKEAKERVKEFADLAKKHGEFEAARLVESLNVNQQAIEAEDKKYQDQIKGWQAFLNKKGVTKAERDEAEKKIEELDNQRIIAVMTLREKQEKELVEKIKAIRAGLNDQLKSELDQQKDIINKKYDEMLDAGADRPTVEAERILALGELEKKIAREVQAEREKINAENAESERQEAENRKQKALNDRIEQSEALIATTRNITDAVFQIGQNNRQAELNAQIRMLDGQRQRELSNKNLTEAQKKAINDKYDKKEAELRRAQFEQEKKAAIAQALINGAIAMTKVSAQTGILTFAFSPIIAAATAAQIAVIASQKAPEFEQGGILPDGPRHTDGGINLVGPYGEVYGQIEGGEPVLSRKTYANNKGIIDALLNSGGQPLNYERVMSAVSAREARMSGGATAQGREAKGGGGVDLSGLQQQMATQTRIFADMAQKFKEFTEKPLGVDWNDRAYDDYRSKKQEIKERASL